MMSIGHNDTYCAIFAQKGRLGYQAHNTEIISSVGVIAGLMELICVTHLMISKIIIFMSA